MDNSELWYNYHHATSHPSPYFTPTPTSSSCCYDNNNNNNKQYHPFFSASSSSHYDYGSTYSSYDQQDEQAFGLPSAAGSDGPSPSTLLNLCCPIPPSIHPLHHRHHHPISISSPHSPSSFSATTTSPSLFPQSHCSLPSTPAIPLPPPSHGSPSSAHKLSVSLLSPHTLLPNLIHAALTIRHKQGYMDQQQQQQQLKSYPPPTATTTSSTGITTAGGTFYSHQQQPQQQPQQQQPQQQPQQQQLPQQLQQQLQQIQQTTSHQL
eukprot:GHVS01030144.1.p1 GENE.GHVS01030144.1~~GHVS01030144.1.p1  ORF type:complete len:264 (-),score=104.23 GHVS01030144.1:53-844(-)